MADPKETAQSAQAQDAAESFEIKTEDRSWFENLLDEAKGRPLTAEENQRLAEKLKGYDAGIEKYKKSVEGQRRSLEAREQEVLKVAEELKSAKTSREQSSILKGASSDVRDLIEEAIERSDDPNGRETLRWLKRVFDQKTSKIDDLEKAITELRQSFQGVSRTALISREQSLVSEIKELDKRYGEAVTDKYRDAILQYGTQYPNYSARRLLHMIADPDEIEQAVELQARRTKAPASNGATRPSSQPTSTQSEHPSEKFRGKTTRDIKKGYDKAFDAAFEAIKGKMPGL